MTAPALQAAAALRHALSSRSPRERVLLAALALVLAGGAVWTGVAQPLRDRAALLEDRIRRHTLALPRVAALPPADPQPQAASDSRPLPAILTETATAAGLDLYRLRDQGGPVSVTIEAAAFDAVVLWFETLETRHRLRLARVTMARAGAPGTVAVTLEVTR
jgi:type II secretory pathway component PulM